MRLIGSVSAEHDQVAASGSYVSDGGATQKIEGQHDAFGAGKLEVTEPGKFSLTVSNTGHGKRHAVYQHQREGICVHLHLPLVSPIW